MCRGHYDKQRAIRLAPQGPWSSERVSAGKASLMMRANDVAQPV